MTKIPHRASPLPPEERKAAIIRAVIPAMIEHGSSLTSRQIAEAAGVAEGTVFRAFGDKDTLLREAGEEYLDSAELQEHLLAIDPGLPLEEKIEAILRHIQDRMHGVISVMSAIGFPGGKPPQLRGREQENTRRHLPVIAELLRRDLKQLCAPDEDVAAYIHLVALATSIPLPAERRANIPPRDLARLIAYGVAGTAPESEANRCS